MARTRGARERERQAVVDAGMRVFRERLRTRHAVATRAAGTIQRAWRGSLRPVTGASARVHRSRVVRDPRGRPWNARDLYDAVVMHEDVGPNIMGPATWPDQRGELSAANRQRVRRRGRVTEPTPASLGRQLARMREVMAAYRRGTRTRGWAVVRVRVSENDGRPKSHPVPMRGSWTLGYMRHMLTYLFGWPGEMAFIEVGGVFLSQRVGRRRVADEPRVWDGGEVRVYLDGEVVDAAGRRVHPNDGPISTL